MDSLKQLTETLFKRMEKKDLTSSGEFTLPLGCGEYLEETATGHAYRFPLGLAIENGLPDHGDVLLTGVESIYPARLLMSSSTTVILETEAPIPEEDLCAFLSLRVDPYQIPNQVTGPHYAKKAETAGPVLDKADIDPMFFRNNHYFSPEGFHALTAERLCDMGVGVVTEGEVTGDLMRMILRFLRNNRSVLVVTDTAAKGERELIIEKHFMEREFPSVVTA